MTGIKARLKQARRVVRTLFSEEKSEDGALVRTSIGRAELKILDPFLMLEEFRVAPPAGFPDHPHRGQENVNYILDGCFTHQDFFGHRGVVKAGDVQWMTAGRGIMHSEMPLPGPKPAHGLQLWVNLGTKDRMVEPAYREVESSKVPKAEKDGVFVAVIAGESLGLSSPAFTRTPILYLHFTLQPGTAVEQPIPEHWNAFLYVLSGAATFEEGGEEVGAHHTLELGQGDGVKVVNMSSTTCSFLLLAGKPLGETAVKHRHYGFAMSTSEEIMQTLSDYQHCRNGFEKARGWSSS